jgi:hypothetical protein
VLVVFWLDCGAVIMKNNRPFSSSPKNQRQNKNLTEINHKDVIIGVDTPEAGTKNTIGSHQPVYNTQEYIHGRWCRA